MKKLAYTLPIERHVAFSKPVKDYVIRFETVAGSLLVRLFRLSPPERFTAPVSDVQIEPATTVETTLLRKINSDPAPFMASAVTSDESATSKHAREIGRYIFSPTITEGVECGSGERNDFAAFVFGMNTAGELDEPYNWFTQSTDVKGSLPRTARLRNSQPMFVLYSDKAGAQLNDWTLVQVKSPPFIIEDTTVGDTEVCASNFVMGSLLPSINLSSAASVASNSETIINVTVSRSGTVINYDGELVVETVSGYVPKTRVFIQNGIGSFKAMALGLTTGDELRVKIGTKNITGMADISIPVA